MPLGGMFSQLVTLPRWAPEAAARLKGVRARPLGVGRAAPTIAKAQGGLPSEGVCDLWEDGRNCEPR